MGEVYCNHSKAPWSSKLMAMVMSQGGSAVVAGEGGYISVVVGT